MQALSEAIIVNLRSVRLCFLLVVLFFYLYGVNFTFLLTYTSRIIALVAWSYLVFSLLGGARFRLNVETCIFVMLYFAYLTWVLIGAGLYGFSDISILISVVLLFLHSCIGGLFFAIVLKKMDLSYRNLILLVQIAIVVQAFFIVLYFVSWDFREFTFAYIPERGNIDYTNNLFRSRGLTHGGGARLSLVQSFGLLFTAYLISTVTHKSKEFYYLVLSCGLIFISVFITGRTGLLMVPVVFLYMFSLLLIHLYSTMCLRRNMVKFLIGVPVGVAFFYFLLKIGYQHVLGGFSTEFGEDGFARLLRWVTEEFISDGQIQSRTVQALQKHWFFPEGQLVFFLGDPTTWSLNRIPSDIGIVRLWHGSGAIGVFMFYSIYIYVFLLSILRAVGIEAKLMLFSLALFLFVTEAKEPFLVNLDINSFLMLIFCYLVVIKPFKHVKTKVV